MLFFKHQKSGGVIAPTCYHQLLPHEQDHYVPTDETPTHKVEREEDSYAYMLTAIVAGSVAAPVSAIVDL